MMTSCFAISRNHPNAVAIVRYLPRWQKFTGRVYQDLAPTPRMFNMAGAAFDRAFAAYLARLDPHRVYADLGPDAILLCYEKPLHKCHRRQVAEFLEAALGIEVPELGYSRAETGMEADMPEQAPKKKRGIQLPLLEWIL